MFYEENIIVDSRKKGTKIGEEKLENLEIFLLSIKTYFGNLLIFKKSKAAYYSGFTEKKRM